MFLPPLLLPLWINLKKETSARSFEVKGGGLQTLSTGVRTIILM
jgi:hypothetical protein